MATWQTNEESEIESKEQHECMSDLLLSFWLIFDKTTGFSSLNNMKYFSVGANFFDILKLEVTSRYKI